MSEADYPTPTPEAPKGILANLHHMADKVRENAEPILWRGLAVAMVLEIGWIGYQDITQLMQNLSNGADVTVLMYREIIPTAAASILGLFAASIIYDLPKNQSKIQ